MVDRSKKAQLKIGTQKVIKKREVAFIKIRARTRAIKERRKDSERNWVISIPLEEPTTFFYAYLLCASNLCG